MPWLLFDQVLSDTSFVMYYPWSSHVVKIGRPIMIKHACGKPLTSRHTVVIAHSPPSVLHSHCIGKAVRSKTVTQALLDLCIHDNLDDKSTVK